jgi:HEAT repeat protein
LSFFLEIVNRYRNLATEPDGDLVTCLWKEDLPHIRYHAAEVFLETTPAFDFSNFNPWGKTGPATMPGKQQNLDQAVESVSGTSANKPMSKSGLNLATMKNQSDLVVISAKEKRMLREMVISEESWNNTEDIIDVLLIILEDQDNQSDFKAFMDVILAEFKDTLSRGEFKYSRLLLQRLRDKAPKFQYQAGPVLVNQFFLDISNPETLGELSNSLPGIHADDTDRIRNLKQTLAMLHPQAVPALAPLISQTTNRQLQQAILEGIGFLAKKDFVPLEQAIANSDSFVTRKLILVMGYIKGSKSLRALRRLTRHPADEVREDALKLLLKRNAGGSSSLFYLIEDSNPKIRQLLLQHLGHRRDPKTEKRLLDYLANHEYHLRENKHLLACYRTLGLCGSPLCLPFLRRTLTGRPLMDILNFSGSVHRHGAAMALKLSDLPEAAQVLSSAAKSIFPNIRRAAQTAQNSLEAQA